jgi:hypothetical protein
MLTLRSLIIKHQSFIESILSDDYTFDKLLESSVDVKPELNIAYLGSMMGIALMCNEEPVSSINKITEIMDLPIDIENWSGNDLNIKCDEKGVLRMIFKELGIIKNRDITGTPCNEPTLITIKSESEVFEQDVRNYYEVKDIKCNHEENIFTLWFQDVEEHGIYSFETDGWTKFTYCAECVKWMIESAVCSGEFMNFRLFKNGKDVSDYYYNIKSYPLKTDVLKFYWYDHVAAMKNKDTDIVYTFVLRKRDFQTYYESYFYKRVKKWYTGYTLDALKITKALNKMPDKKVKFWNVKKYSKDKFDPNGWLKLMKLEYLLEERKELDLAKKLKH